MDKLKDLMHLFGGKLEIVNILALLLISFIICSFLQRKWSKWFASLISSLFISLQLLSLYFTKSFVGYSFYVHLNTRDFFKMYSLFSFQIVVFLTFFILLGVFLYNAEYLTKLFYKKSKSSQANKLPKFAGLFLIIFSIIVLSLERGIIEKSLELRGLLKTEEKPFKEALDEIGLFDYISPTEIKAIKGKNVIIVSLESYEQGYLSEKMAHLTPNLQGLKSEWSYKEMQENEGSTWTSGSLYTYLTGFPALFGRQGNSIFQSSYHSNVSAISHVFNKAGYEMTFLTEDVEFSGTKEMLFALGIKNIIDKNDFKEVPKDLDLFEMAQDEIKNNIDKDKPFVLFLSTMSTHNPNGIYDERMEKFVTKQSSDLEFMVSAVDYMIGNLIKFLKEKGLLSNTAIYIFPDHLKMGDPSIFSGTGERGLFLLSNINNKHFQNNNPRLNQIDLPRIILNGANIQHNVTFLSDYISEDINGFIAKNRNELTTLNKSGLLRLSKSEIKNDPYRFIAHAGGVIEGITYTNSLEALNSNYRKGFKLFELDIIRTSDGEFVAAHDWKFWAEIVGYSGNLPASKEEFLKYSICGKFTPLDMNRINKWFEYHRDAILVTDKINEPKEFSNQFYSKERLMMELFSMEAVKEGINSGIRSSIPSQNVISQIGGDKIKILKELRIKDVAISHTYINSNRKFLKELKNNGINSYIYHVNFEKGKDESYFLKYEMDYIYGMYADQWSFQH